MPAGASSTTRHRDGSTPSAAAAARYGCGSGLPRSTSSAVTSTRGSGRPPWASLVVARRRDPEVATAQRSEGSDSSSDAAPGSATTPSVSSLSAASRPRVSASTSSQGATARIVSSVRRPCASASTSATRARARPPNASRRARPPRRSPSGHRRDRTGSPHSGSSPRNHSTTDDEFGPVEQSQHTTDNQGGTRGKARLDISMSLDGFVAGPNQSKETHSARAASSCTNGPSGWRRGASLTAWTEARSTPPRPSWRSRSRTSAQP